jgi:protein TonB
MSLVEDELSQSRAKVWSRRVATALALVGLVVGLTVLARTFVSKPDAPRRQVAKITILPDTPPPPPPPREEPKKEPPKEQLRPQPEVPKPQQAPPEAPQPLKMEGPAGDGPSAFQAGPVTQDYQGGPPVLAGASAPGGAMASDRAQERFYANSARQMLRDEIERHLRQEAGELTATFALWVEPDGRIRRYEVTPSGVNANDVEMNLALDGAARALRLPPPGTLAQPMRFRLTVRSQG